MTFENLGETLSVYLPTILAAVAILVIGWLIAFAISKLVERLLNRTTLDDRVANMMQGDPAAQRLPIERWIALAVFWLIMLGVIVAFLNTINVPAITGPLNDLLGSFLAFLPGLLGAAVLLLIAFVIASILKVVITRVISASGLSRRLSETADVAADERGRMQIGETIGNVAFWLVFLLFLPAVLDALNLQGMLTPVNEMVNGILGFLPNLLGAALVLVVGWLIARIIRSIVTNLLAGVGVDRIGAAAIPTTGTAAAAATAPPAAGRLSNLIGTIVFVLVLIPVIIAALNVLDIPAVSQPAANMLTNFLNALPNIFAAILLVGIAYFVARIVGNFVASLLTGIGFDRIFAWMAAGVTPGQISARARPAGPAARTAAEEAARPGEPMPGRVTPSKIVGYIVTVGILLFAVMEAANLLGFEALTLLLSQFIVSLVNILFGLIIFGIGLYLGNLAYRTIYHSGMSQAPALAQAARLAIIVFATALALREMGIAESIVNLAFGLLLGAIAVAIALAFGLGGREVAGRTLERWQAEAREGRLIPATGRPPVDPDEVLGPPSTTTGPTGTTGPGVLRPDDEPPVTSSDLPPDMPEV